MRMPTTYDETWIYHPDATTGAQVRLDAMESGHLFRVLRLLGGTRCTVTDGRGSVYAAEVEDADPNKGRLRIHAREQELPRPKVGLVQALLKARGAEEVLDVCLQTPLRAFQPVRSERCQVPAGAEREVPDRWRQKAIAALQQSKQAWLCELREPCRLEEWLEAAHAAGESILFADPCGSPATAAPDWIAIGPEGGWSPRELDEARGVGAGFLSLGPSRLRATAAGIYALGGVIPLSVL